MVAGEAILGEGFTISGSSWTIPADVWTKIVDRLAPTNADGRVYYAVKAKDAVNRKTLGAVRSFRVVP